MTAIEFASHDTVFAPVAFALAQGVIPDAFVALRGHSRGGV